MENLMQKLDEATQYIQDQTDVEPEFGIILGTGLDGLADQIEKEDSIDYGDIPHFPISTVSVHSGELIFGTLRGKKVVALSGRFHYYEGYTMQKIVFPVRVLKKLGIERLFLSNACGSLNPDIKEGELMIIEDHINMLGDNPLIGENYEELGPRFPDMSEPYDKEMIEQAEKLADKLGIKVHKGVYVSVQGPNLETSAEYKWLRIIGGDTVGMSTVPEAIAARHMRLPTFGMSVITDEGFHEELEEISLEHVVAAANEAQPKVTKLFSELIATL
jgi:purine-nucleoside phosphorylase